MFGFGNKKIIKKWKDKSLDDIRKFFYENFPLLAWERIYVRVYDDIKDKNSLDENLILKINKLAKSFYGKGI